MKDMAVAEIDYSDEWGDTNDPESDWRKLMSGAATFAHTGACEFIVYLGSREHDTLTDLEVKWRMSKEFMEYCRIARRAGFKYACFHN